MSRGLKIVLKAMFFLVLGAVVLFIADKHFHLGTILPVIINVCYCATVALLAARALLFPKK